MSLCSICATTQCDSIREMKVVKENGQVRTIKCEKFTSIKGIGKSDTCCGKCKSKRSK